MVNHLSTNLAWLCWCALSLQHTHIMGHICTTVIIYLRLYFLLSVFWRCWLGGRKGIRPLKNWVVGCWRSYLSGARCRFAYAQLMPLPLTISCSSKSRLVLPSWFYLSGTGSTSSPRHSPGGRKLAVVVAVAVVVVVVIVYFLKCVVQDVDLSLITWPFYLEAGQEPPK